MKSILIYVSIVVAISLPAFGQDNASNAVFKIEEVSSTITISNVRFVTADGQIDRETLKNPIPLDPEKLLPPETQIYVLFDYESDFQPSSDPAGISQIWITPMYLPTSQIPGIRGYGQFSPAKWEPKGTGFFSLQWSSGKTQQKTEFGLRLGASKYDSKRKFLGNSESTVVFPLKFVMDGEVMLSSSQFDAIKAMFKRVAELEKRVKELESLNTPQKKK
jgi:hypothetical protein